MYLLDTTIIIDYVRGSTAVKEYITALKSPIISSITEAEVYAGAKDKKMLQSLGKTFKAFTLLPITSEITRQAIIIIKTYKLSNGIGILDAFIAATAMVSGYSLVTSNSKHFLPIKGLEVIDWKSIMEDYASV